MKLHTLILFLLIPCSVLYAQVNGVHSDYDWETTPTIYIPEEEDLDEDVITVFEKHHHQFTYFNSDIQRYELLHIKKHLLSDKAIEQENKFYVWTKDSRKIFQLKARVIQPSGKIIELNEDNIIESKDNRGKVRYRYFAFEGIEKGSTIEYLHYMCFVQYGGIGNPKSHHFVDVNGAEKKKNVEITILFDDKLTLSSYSNNALYQLSEMSSEGRDRLYSLNIENLEKIPKERYSNISKSRYRLFYHIDSKPEASSYESMSKDLNIYFQQVDRFFQKPFKRMIRTLVEGTLSPADTTNLQKLKAVERKLKEEYILVDEVFLTWEGVEATKRINELYTFTYMIEAARYLGIETRMELSCDRRELIFPSSYESYVFLDKPMLYFPSENAFFIPNTSTRIGPAPYQYAGNNALVVWMEDSYKSIPRNAIIPIPVPPIDYSTDSIRTAVTIDPTTLQATIQLDRSVSGYFADPYQAGISQLNEEELREVKEGFFTYLLSKSAALGDYTFENDNSAAFNDKPLVGHVTATSSTLVSEAGGKLLVNIGTLIGPQSNMYQEKPEERQLPVDLNYKHRYSREIRLTIPEGYKAVNVADLNRNVTPDPALTIGFSSRYKLNGNELVVYIEEWYNQLTYPKEQYGYVVDVFNAAADFNALTLVLEKQ